jgi:hypothetical protein
MSNERDERQRDDDRQPAPVRFVPVAPKRRRVVFITRIMPRPRRLGGDE